MIEIDTRKSIDSVQYLRALAALIVLVSHAFEHPLNPYTTRDIFVTGRLGVVLFFVISGFIMVTVTGTKRFSSRTFLTKRVLRVVPFYWVVTVVTAIGAIYLPFAFKSTSVDLKTLITSLLFVPAVNPANGGIQPLIKLGWTLNYEMFFYVVFSGLAAMMLKPRIIVATTFFVALVLFGNFIQTNSAALTFYTNSVQLGFVGGMLVGAFCLEYDISRVPASAAFAAGLAALGLTAGCFLFRTGDVYAYSLGFALMIVAASVLLLFIGLWLERREQLPRSRIAHFIGDASYSIYLVHMFGVGFVVAVAGKMAVPLNGIGYAAIVVLALSGGLIAGCLAYVFVEKPLVTFSRKLVSGRTDKAPAAG